MRKKVSVILILFIVCAVLCTSVAASTSLMLSHAVNVPLEYRLSFREYTPIGISGSEMTEKTFDSGGRYLFTALYLTFNKTLMFDSLTVSFTNLVKTDDNTKYYDYQMEVLVPGDETTHLVEVVEADGGHGAGSARVISSATAFRRTNTDATEDVRLADFAITLGEDGVEDGTYTGTVTIDFVAN